MRIPESLNITRWGRGRLLFWGSLLAAFVLGYLLRGGSEAPAPGAPAPEGTETAAEEVTWWTCSMHPQIKLRQPGQCPICFMDLIPLEEDAGGGLGPRTLVMSEGAKKLAEIRTATVRREFVENTIRMVGKVEVDETRLAELAAWVPGRLDRLYVDFTGITVNQGDHMVDIYSPELLAAHEELLQALEAVRELRSSEVGIMRETAQATVEAVRERLRLWGLTPEQIRELETEKETSDHVTIYAPTGGVVIEKHAVEGAYVKTGSRIYTIADLSRVWVKLDAYESDLVWIRYGQEVEFTTEALPGEVFRGRLVFIDPVVDPKTRTVKVRVNVDNPDRKLKPEMFVRAVVRARVAGAGQVMDPALAGKWISPMHPEIVKDHPGKCDVCGMPLVRAEELGYVTASAGDAPLVIPASAPLVTGERAVVYVQVPDTERPTFEGREVVLGPRAGDHYLVRSGLAEGEEVVTNGNFKIDSALQIQAKPSMMSPDAGAPAPGHRHGDETVEPGATRDAAPSVPGSFRRSLGPVYEAYFALHDAVFAGDAEASASRFEAVKSALAGVETGDLGSDSRAVWGEIDWGIDAGAEAGLQAAGMEPLRVAFRDISEAMIDLEKRFGHPGHADHVRIFCPMAFDNQGASWLQDAQETRNPYYGAKMPRCGAVKETFPGTHDE